MQQNCTGDAKPQRYGQCVLRVKLAGFRQALNFGVDGLWSENIAGLTYTASQPNTGREIFSTFGMELLQLLLSALFLWGVF